MTLTKLPPACCRRCRHLVTLITGSERSSRCLKALPLSASCAWWAPRRTSLPMNAANDVTGAGGDEDVTAGETV